MNDSLSTRYTNAPPVTIEMLSEKAPLVQAGDEADARLRELPPPTTSDERRARRELTRISRAGKKAQEELFLSITPLLISIAKTEYNRRQAWGSRTTFADAKQEATIGFLKGLRAFKAEKTNVSSTNYLGLWMKTEMSRELERLDHDFKIPVENALTNRKIIAVRSRLLHELQREPTDAELLAGLNDPDWNAGQKYGRKKATSDAPPTEDKFTQAHIDRFKQYQDRFYSFASNEPVDTDDEAVFERSSASLSAPEPVNIDAVEDSFIRNSKQEFFASAFLLMRIGSKQKDIILRHFGLTPYSQEQKYSEITNTTGLSSRFVRNVIMGFNQYMPQKGGIFHHLLLKLDEDTIYDLEMHWLLPILGEWPKNQINPIAPPTILTQAK